MSIMPFNSASGGFTNVTNYPDIPPDSAAMRKQFQTPIDELATYINNTLLAGIADISGWTSSTATFSLSSDADAPNYNVASSADVTSNFYACVKVRFTQDLTVKYAIVMVSSGTSQTWYGGTDYVITSSAITNVYFSTAKAPAGFPLNPDKWSIILTNPSNVSLSTSIGIQNTGIYQDIPIGLWNLSFKCEYQASISSTQLMEMYVALSTSTSSISNQKLSACALFSEITASVFTNLSDFINLSVKTRYYILAAINVVTTDAHIRGDNTSTIIRATCAYL